MLEWRSIVSSQYVVNGARKANWFWFWTRFPFCLPLGEYSEFIHVCINIYQILTKSNMFFHYLKFVRVVHVISLNGFKVVYVLQKKYMWLKSSMFSKIVNKILDFKIFVLGPYKQLNIANQAFSLLRTVFNIFVIYAWFWRIIGNWKYNIYLDPSK